MKRFNLYFLDEIKPNGERIPVWTGTKLKSEIKVFYNVNYGTVQYFKAQEEKKNNGSTYEIRSERY